MMTLQLGFLLSVRNAGVNKKKSNMRHVDNKMMRSKRHSASKKPGSVRRSANKKTNSMSKARVSNMTRKRTRTRTRTRNIIMMMCMNRKIGHKPVPITRYVSFFNESCFL